MTRTNHLFILFFLKRCAISFTQVLLALVGIFLIANPAPADDAISDSLQKDGYARTVLRYYEALSSKEYREAYDLLGQCEVQLHSADGSGVAYHPRRIYALWLKSQQNVESLTILGIRRFQPGKPSEYTADKGDAEATLGIKIYCLDFNLKLHEEEPAQRSGPQSRCVSVVKGNDGKIRILGIGTGP